MISGQKLMAGLSSVMSKHDLFRGGAGVVGLRSSAAALGFLNAVILARLLSLESYGILAQVIAAATTLATVLTLGMPQLLTRELAAHQAHDRWSVMKGIVRWAYRNVLTVCLVTMVVSIVVLLTILPESWRAAGVFGILMSIFLAFNLVRAAVLRGLNRAVVADVPETVVQPLAILCLIGLTLHIAPHDGFIWAASVQLAGILSATALGIYLLRRSWPIACIAAPAEALRDEWKGPAATFFLINTLAIAEGQIAVLLTGALAGSEQAGLFHAANRIVSVMVLGLVAVNAPLMAKLSAAWAKDDRHRSQELVTQAMKFGVFLAISIALPLFFFPGWFLGLFGETYKQADTAMRILVIGQFVNAVSGPCGLVLAMTGHQYRALWALAMAVTVNLMINLIFTGDLGVVGAAMAVTGSLFVWNVMMAYWSWRHVRINTTLLRYGHARQ